MDELAKDPKEYRFKNTHTTGPKFDVNLYKSFISEPLCILVKQELENLPWKNLNRRSNLTFGNEGLIYTINYRNQIIQRKAKSWSECPVLHTLKGWVEKAVNEELNICVVQRYPNGRIGIKPHRDKEMKQGTKICGISFGAERTLRLTYCYNKSISKDLKLNQGSMYVFNPPTNDYYTHEILTDKTSIPRFSLTFRNYV